MAAGTIGENSFIENFMSPNLIQSEKNCLLLFLALYPTKKVNKSVLTRNSLISEKGFFISYIWVKPAGSHDTLPGTEDFPCPISYL